MKRFILLFLVISLTSCEGQTKAYQSVSMQEFIKVYKGTNKFQLLDVRTPEEYQQGFIEGAILNNIFAEDFIATAKKSLDKELPVYVYCRSGRRSVKATKLLKENGFTKVINVEGGYLSWIKLNKE